MNQKPLVVSLAWAMAPAATVQFMLIASILGIAILVPALVLMFRVFKTAPREASEAVLKIPSPGSPGEG